MSNILSGAGHLLLGYGRTDPSVVNSTPQAYQQLAPGLASSMQGMLQNPNRYTGPYAAPLGAGEQQGIGQVADAAGQVGQQGMGQAALMNQASGQMNPFSNPSFLQQMGLRNVMQQSGMQNGQAQGVAGQMMGGVMNPFAGAIGMSGAEMQGLGQVGQTAFGANPLTDATNQSIMSLMGGQQNPYVDQLIASAQRPILDNFSDQALQQRGLYTGAGQQIQGQGSSPFAMASARLVGSTTGALNDASLGIANNAYNQDMQARLQGTQMGMQQPGLQLQNQLSGLSALGMPRQIAQQGLDAQNAAFGQMQQNQLSGAGLSDQLQGNSLSRALTGLNAASGVQQQQATGYENAANRQLQAGQSLSANDLASQQAALQAQMQNLQAQGLPRLVAQQGIDAGLGQFNTQQNQLLQLMQLIAQASGPNTNVLGGMPSENGAVQQAGNSFMQGFGSALSDRRAKKDIQRVGSIGDVPAYRFRYLWEDDNAPLRVGVMADEVEHIPGAVTRAPGGLAFVNYDKVMAHGIR